MEVGDTIYIRDQNRQVWVQGENGKRRLDPAGYWRAYTIVGETRISWLLSGHEDYKVDKATMCLRVKEPFGMDGRVYTVAEKEELAWRDKHFRAVIRLVETADTPTLRQIAALVGYEEET